ncbi:MAG TPA: hypothetical protein VFW78_01000 [Bacteroidia bacterium]|nr:hypothetical protein [Bacteroidia bacterium]
MKNVLNKWEIIVASLFLGAMIMNAFSGCKHDPPLTISTNNSGNGGGSGSGGGNGGGGVTGTGIPCDPDSVYFDEQILPILIANCTNTNYSVGCHNAASAADGFIAISYTSVINTGNINLNNPWNSDFAEKIFDNDPSDKMPPAQYGAPPLDSTQINLITMWLNQGAQYLTCNPNYGGCDSVNVTYNGTIKPILQAKCVTCHTGSNPGGGVNLSGYSGVNAVAVTGQLVGSVSHLNGYYAMPKGTNPLPSCEVAQIRNWVLQGALNN